ncbi:MAG TPA: SRPBCC family protein [Gemmatimonadaceae bacterium]|nr:SRPBCC family protein [Gemmatimonadaceae bacterium]
MDVRTEILIGRPRAEVAEWSADPERAPLWYANIKRVEWVTEPPIARGSRVTFTAEFLRRQLRYTYEIVDFVAGERLVMRTSEGPFPMETTYEWSDAGEGRTLMRLRNKGAPSGFARVLAPFMGPIVRSENRKDLRRLKAILELRGQSARRRYGV